MLQRRPSGRHELPQQRPSLSSPGGARSRDGGSLDGRPAATWFGAGSIRSEYEQIGLDFDRGAVRVARLAEALAVIKGLLRGEWVTLAGRYYRPQLLSLAAREADIVGLSGITFQHGGAAPPDLSGWRVSSVDKRIGLIKKVAGKERFGQLETNALVQRVIVTDKRREVAPRSWRLDGLI